MSLFLLREGKPRSNSPVWRHSSYSEPAGQKARHIFILPTCLPVQEGDSNRRTGKGRLKGSRLVTPNQACWISLPPSILARCFFSCKVSGHKSGDSASKNGKFSRRVLHGRRMALIRKEWAVKHESETLIEVLSHQSAGHTISHCASQIPGIRIKSLYILAQQRVNELFSIFFSRTAHLAAFFHTFICHCPVSVEFTAQVTRLVNKFICVCIGIFMWCILNSILDSCLIFIYIYISFVQTEAVRCTQWLHSDSTCTLQRGPVLLCTAQPAGEIRHYVLSQVQGQKAGGEKNYKLHPESERNCIKYKRLNPFLIRMQPIFNQMIIDAAIWQSEGQIII